MLSKFAFIKLIIAIIIMAIINSATITLFNGLGDKMLDLIGFTLLCKYLNYNPIIKFDTDRIFAWGSCNYDLRLFNFNDITISNDPCNFYVRSPNPSASLSPYKIYEFVRPFIPEITLEKVSKDFVYTAKRIISPSEIIKSYIPEGIENAYGVHLRKSDKLTNHGDIRFENLFNEFQIITDKLTEDINFIIDAEPDAKFIIVSEDTIWKNEITEIILNKRKGSIIYIDYNHNHEYANFASILDMFCLSRCKEILQGVKYSSFSILSSILGTNKLRNYSNYINSYDCCLSHIWSHTISINNKCDINLLIHNANNVIGIDSNISGKYIIS